MITAIVVSLESRYKAPNHIHVSDSELVQSCVYKNKFSTLLRRITDIHAEERFGKNDDAWVTAVLICRKRTIVTIHHCPMIRIPQIHALEALNGI